MISKSRTALMVLSSIMSIRMLGLFMILPVFSVYAAHMPGADATLIGVALGMYGLTQAVFQIPFGMLSDRIGRKPVILAGLLLLIIGSVVAACAHSMDVLILGRALQGMGAIGSTVLALLADLTRDESRSKAMAFMGLSIGFAFTIAMIAGPVINHWLHLSGIFWVTGLLAIIGVLSVALIPTPPKPARNVHEPTLTTGISIWRDFATFLNRNVAISQPSRAPLAGISSSTFPKKSGKSFAQVFHNRELLRLNGGIFSLHTILTALFVAIPLLLTHDMHLSEWQQISLYLSVLVLAFMFAVPFIIIAEKKRKMKPVFIAAIIAIFVVQIGLYFFHHDIAMTVILLFAFFTAFTLLEATLPSLVSKIAPIQNKGAAMGVYSSSQFFGIFVGGAVGGLIFSHAGLSGVFAFCAGMNVLWLLFAVSMKKPPYLSTMVFPMDTRDVCEYDALASLAGVAEIAIVSSENLLYVKIDKEKISEPELRNAINGGNL